MVMERGFSLLLFLRLNVSRDRRLMTGIHFISTWRVPIDSRVTCCARCRVAPASITPTSEG